MPIHFMPEDVEFYLLSELQKIEPFLNEMVDEVVNRYGKEQGIHFIKECVQDEIIKYYMIRYACAK